MSYPLIISPKFKFVDEDLVILRAPRKNDVYSLDLKNIIPSGGITCLVAKATEDEAVLLAKKTGHVKFKKYHKKGKQHRASCKKIEERTVREPLELLHMDLFGPVSVESVNRKKYCLVVTDDCSKFSWVFFLAYKDETYDMLHDLIVGLENRLRHKVKTIRMVDHWNRMVFSLPNSFDAVEGRTMQGQKCFNSSTRGVGCFMDLPGRQEVIGTKWVFRNKRDERGTIIKNKARLVAQGYRQEEGVDYDEVWMSQECILIWQTSLERSVVCILPPGFEGSCLIQQGLQSCQGTLWPASSPKSMVYVDDIIFGSTKSSMVKDFDKILMQNGIQDEIHGCELTFLLGGFKSSNPMVFFLVKTNIDMMGTTIDRRSTSGGCQYLGRRLVSWHAKKQTIVAISSTRKRICSKLQSCCAQLGTSSHEDYSLTQSMFRSSHSIGDGQQDTKCAVTPMWKEKLMRSEEVNNEEKEASNDPNLEIEAGPSSPSSNFKYGLFFWEEQNNDAEVLCLNSRQRFVHSWSHQTHTLNSKLKVILIPKDKGNRIWLKEPKKNEINPSTQSEPWNTTNDEEVARKIQAEWDAEEERKRYPLSRELMIRMLDHGMEVEDETETAITLIHLFILWTTEDGDNS
ncbi:putative ribonuclease H-like domain-containing protein [Tanacetum coccineum]